MKGLLLKDLYMIKHYCKTYLLISCVFLAASVVDPKNLFFAFYPCLLCGMIPVNLLSYDERSRFLQYGATLPYTRSQIVSARYLIGLFVQLAVLLAVGVVQGVRMAVSGSFSPGELAVILLTVLAVSTVSSAIPMPFMFRFGVERGRVAYYVMIGFVCGASVLFSKVFAGGLPGSIPSGIVFAALAVLGAGAYALSWLLSVAFYRKREL